jgi:hypothetical protein
MFDVKSLQILLKKAVIEVNVFDLNFQEGCRVEFKSIFKGVE